MNITSLFTQVNSAYRGSDDDPPTSGTDFNLWLATANRKQYEWASDAKNVWLSNFSYEKPNEPGTAATAATTTLTGTSTYFTDYNVGDMITVSGETVRTIATITSDTVLTVTVAFTNTASAKTFTHVTILQSGIRSYSLHRNLLNPSDKAIVVTTNGDYDFVIGKPADRHLYDNEVYIASRTPQKLIFPTGISSTVNTNVIGGTLKVPGYYIPNDMTLASDVVSVDDPYWLVYAVASELAFNDITYSDKSPDLNAKANNLYTQMISLNRRGTNNNPRIARTNVNRIISTESESGVGTL
jgi:hypothetical protein